MAIDTAFGIDVKGSEAIIKKFNKIQKVQFREVFEKIADLMYASMKKNFEVSGRPKAWKGLSPAYKAWKKEQVVFSNKTLIFSGDLFYSVTGQSSDSIKKITAKSLKLGTGVKSKDGYPYWKVHQYGAPKANIVMRRFAGFQDNDKKEINHLFSIFMEKALVNA